MRPTTIPEYVEAAPPAAQPHLRRIYAILTSVAPKAEGIIKWNTPFFVEPRFLFSFSAHKAHLGFVATADTLEPFRNELSDFEITKMGIVKVPYTAVLPEDVIRQVAEARLLEVSAREDDSFW